MTFLNENHTESTDSHTDVPEGEKVTVSVVTSSANAFASFGLVAPLLQNVAELGFTQATPVQVQVIPAAMAGGDLLVSSQTGSGKTAAFLLPLLHQLLASNPSNSPVPGRAQPKVLVLCPTRELAQQVAADAINLARGLKGIRIATVMGGMPYGKQIQALKGALLVVATPGRLLDLSDSRAIRLDDVKQLVIDEADRMLDMGFADDLEAIDQRCQQRNQTLMFSATFAPKVMSLATQLTNDAKRIELAQAGDVHSNIEQKLHWADNMAHKHRLLEHLLTDPSVDQAVVFASTQVESEKIADTLRANGYEATALHGAMPQAVRMRRLESLRKGHTKILVATDVAARGIDVPRISHVINFGLPMKPEDYTHRIGRTGRAGRNGIAITLVEHRDRAKIRNIERFTQQDIVASVIPGLEPQAKPSFGGGGGRPGSRSGGRPGARSDARPGNRSGGRFESRSGGSHFEQRSGGDSRPAPRFDAKPAGGYSGDSRPTGRFDSKPAGFSGDSRPANRFDSKPSGARSGDSRPTGRFDSKPAGARSGDSRPTGPRFGKPKAAGSQRRSFGGN
jgi:superfamily II DNA/RNA helicase